MEIIIIEWIFNTASSNLENEPRFHGVYSRDNLPKIKDGKYVINLDEYSDIGTHWVALWVSKASRKDVDNNVT